MGTACPCHAASSWLAPRRPPCSRRDRLSGVPLESSGERFQAALAPTRLSPGASGLATPAKTSSGWRIELDVAGLPRLEGSRFYEAWLRNAAGVLVPIGTFNEGRKSLCGRACPPTTLTVTRERSDAVQASFGEKVLVGTVKTGS